MAAITLSSRQQFQGWKARAPIIHSSWPNPRLRGDDGKAKHPASMTPRRQGPGGSSGWSEVGLRSGWHLLATTITVGSVQAKDKAPELSVSPGPKSLLGTVVSGSRLSRNDRQSHSCWALWGLVVVLQESGCFPGPGAAASFPCSAGYPGHFWSAHWTCPYPEGH